jgi:uncharacterized protein YbjT (DUF2867 family)
MAFPDTPAHACSSFRSVSSAIPLKTGSINTSSRKHRGSPAFSSWTSTRFSGIFAARSPESRMAPLAGRAKKRSRRRRDRRFDPGGGIMPQSILLAGANGLVGGFCLELLLKDPSWDRIVTVTRRPLSMPDSRHENLVINFERLGDFRDRIVADQVICTLGTTIKKAGSRENFRTVDFHYVYELARMARKNGAKHFLLVTAMGADAKSRTFYNRVKGEIERAVSGLGYPMLSIFRPSLLLGKRPEFRLGEEIAKPLAKAVSFALPEKYKPVHARAVAAAIIAVAREQKPGINVYESDAIRRMAAF